MFGSAALDTAIGIAFVFLLVSLACTAAKEFVELLWKKRAILLKEGVSRLLGGNDSKTAVWLQDFYDHHLISALTRDKYTHPAYIPSQTFAQTLMDLIRNKGQIVAVPATPPTETPAIVTMTTEAPATSSATVPTTATASAIVPSPADPRLVAFMDAVGRINNDAVKQAIQAIAGSATATLEDLQKQIETWFNSSMDRVTGWYKRWSQFWVFGIAAFITIMVNVDALVITKALWRDPILREAVAVAAQKQVSENAAAIAKDKPADAPKTATAKDEVDQSWRNLRKAEERIAQTGVPVGWDTTDDRSIPRLMVPVRDENGKVKRDANNNEVETFNWQGWPIKLLGWIITILAASLGAPFWFDMLNRIMVVRTAIKPQDKSKDGK